MVKASLKTRSLSLTLTLSHSLSFSTFSDPQIRRVPMFAECDDSFIDMTVHRLRRLEVASGAPAVTEGDTGREMFIVHGGTLDVLAGKDDKLLAALEPGDFFGEIALLKNTKRNATVRATAPVTLFRLDKADFDELLDAFPMYRELMLEAVAEKQARREVSLLPLHLACRQGERPAVDELLRKNRKVPVAEQLNEKDAVGWTPFHEACFAGHDELAKYLLAAGADIEAFNAEGNRALHLAAMGGHATVVRVLTDAGAQMTAFNEDGSHAVHLAARFGAVAICEALVEAGSDPVARDVNGNTPLHFASNVGELKCVEFFLERGADQGAENSKRATPLHDGALSDSGAVCKALAGRGATVDAPHHEAQTPLQWSDG
jgi:ankyrin repeat protein